MGGFSNPFDPTQQLNQPPPQAAPQPQQQQPPAPQAQPQQAPAAPQGGDPLDTIKQGLAQQYQKLQEEQQQQGGGVKRLLSNYFGAMMGQPTVQMRQNRILSQLQSVEGTQATVGLHQAMSQLYGSTPVTMPDGSTVNVLNKDLGNVQASLARSQATTEAAGIHGAAQIQSAQINQGMMIPVTPEMQKMLNLPPGTSQIPLKQLNEATGIATKPLAFQQGANGPVEVNKLNPSQQTPLGIGNPRVAAMNAMGVPVAETDEQGNPTGNLRLMPRGQAEKTGALLPGSVPFQAQKGVVKSFTSGPVANELNAFNTANAHADLLLNATKALGNGDVRALNSIKNAALTQFGDPDVTNWQAIANAYQREVTSALTKGHITDAEISSAGATLPANASPEQIQGVLKNYKSLMQSKVQQRANQFKQGIQGKPNFGQQPSSTGGTGFAAWKASQR